MMRRVECKSLTATLAGAILTAMISAAPAAAADLGGYKPQAPDPVGEPLRMPQSWAGWYLGGNLGGVVDGDNDGDLTGGGHLGHNWQTGAFVFGGEGDLSFSDDPDTYGSIRARAGFGGGPWLFYGTAGIAIDENDEGLVAGGGIEYKLAEQTSLGVEALNYDLDDNFTVLRGRLTWHFGGGRY